MVIFLFIFVSSIHLALDTPLLDSEGQMAGILEKIDIVLTTIFTIETVLKILAFGAFKGQNAYFRNAWNIMDFFVVIISVIQLFNFHRFYL